MNANLSPRHRRILVCSYILGGALAACFVFLAGTAASKSLEITLLLASGLVIFAARIYVLQQSRGLSRYQIGLIVLTVVLLTIGVAAVIALG